MNTMEMAFTKAANTDKKKTIISEANALKIQREQEEKFIAEMQRSEEERIFKEERAKEAKKNKSKKLWSFHVTKEKYWYECGIIWAKSHEIAREMTKARYPDAVSITVEEIDCSKEFINIGLYVE